jgi:hypothetical protein
MTVYFARVGDYIKVGVSTNPVRRVKNLFQSSTRYGRPADCPLDAPRELLATMPGWLNEEAACHAALSEYAAGGEFFIDEPPVRKFIADAIAGSMYKVPRAAGEFIPASHVTPEQEAHLAGVIANLFRPHQSARRPRGSQL